MDHAASEIHLDTVVIRLIRADGCGCADIRPASERWLRVTTSQKAYTLSIYLYNLAQESSKAM